MVILITCSSTHVDVDQFMQINHSSFVVLTSIGFNTLKNLGEI